MPVDEDDWEKAPNENCAARGRGGGGVSVCIICIEDKARGLARGVGVRAHGPGGLGAAQHVSEGAPDDDKQKRAPVCRGTICMKERPGESAE